MIVRQKDALAPAAKPEPARHDAAQKRAPRRQDNALPMRRHSEPDVYACLRALRAVLDGDRA